MPGGKSHSGDRDTQANTQGLLGAFPLTRTPGQVPGRCRWRELCLPGREVLGVAWPGRGPPDIWKELRGEHQERHGTFMAKHSRKHAV